MVTYLNLWKRLPQIRVRLWSIHLSNKEPTERAIRLFSREILQQQLEAPSAMVPNQQEVGLAKFILILLQVLQ